MSYPERRLAVPLEDVEKDYLLDLIQRVARLFFTEIYGFSLMGDHFHLLLKMIPEDRFSDEAVKQRIAQFGARLQEHLETEKVILYKMINLIIILQMEDRSWM